MSKKAKYKIDEAELTVRNWQGTFVCACGSINSARRIARALNAMEANPKAKPFAFDWSGVPDKYKWAAMDENKQWFAYSRKPKNPSKHVGVWPYTLNGGTYNLPYMCLPPYPGDWRESLQQRP